MYFESRGPDRTVELGEEPTFHDPVSVSESELGRFTEFREGCRLNESVIGDYTYLMERVQADFASVGKFGNIASHARLGATNHPIDRPTAHHFTYRSEMYDLGEDDETIFEWRAGQPVDVGHDVWIGHNATVLPDVSIANGAVVAAGAVVTRDVDPYQIVGGVPAEPIERRFPQRTAARIEATEWWNWDHQTLSDRLTALRDIDTFLAKYAPETADQSV